MAIYDVSFYYEGLTDGIPCSNPISRLASKICCSAERQVERMLDSLGFRFIHAYSWPDGSIYKFVYFNGNPEELRKKLNAAFDERNKRFHWPGIIGVERVYENDYTNEPRFIGMEDEGTNYDFFVKKYGKEMDK